MPKKISRAWTHNMLIGNAVMIKRNAQTIDASTTATGKAKQLARSIYHLADQLEAALREGRNET